MEIREQIMKVIIKINDVIDLAKRFEESPRQVISELGQQVRAGVTEAIEKILSAEIGLFLGRDADKTNKRNGYRVRTFAIKGLGALKLSVPRDRLGRFESKIVPAGLRYDAALENDLALLHLAGLSTRMLSHVSRRVLGINISAQEVSNSLKTIVPAARGFLERPLNDRHFKYLYVDGTNFSVRRTTVAKEPTLVVIGVDAADKKSIIAMVQGDKDSKAAWQMVLATLKERGLKSDLITLGIMDGLPGLADAFIEAFPQATVARCWIHKLRNVMPLVPRRYQSEFKKDWDKMAYAGSKEGAEAAFIKFSERWKNICGDAISRFEKDKTALFCHYDFPKAHWNALRTTNPIERVNKEFKRRSKSMETTGADGLKVLLAFTALRLEYGWAMVPISSPTLANLELSPRRLKEIPDNLNALSQMFLH